MSKRFMTAIFLAWSFTAQAVDLAPVKEGPAQPPPVNVHGMGPIATVGHGRVNADQVFELWTPVWYETLAKVRNGKLDAGEGDRKLNEEWQRAIKALVKDELFFQEAEREHNSFINSIVDRLMRQGADRPRNQMVSEIRRVMQQDMEKFFRRLNNDLVRESGGMIKLHKVLEGRGLTYQEWQNRLKKKAFTQSYLHQILSPRTPDPGPKQVQEYYARNSEEFAQPGLVRFRHIFFSNAVRGEEQARDDAVEVWEQLMDGLVTFEAAAAQFSDDSPSKSNGGLESGEEATDPEREAWLADIRSALREERPGEIAPILESPFGCHLAVLISIGADRKIPFAEVRRDIENKLQSRKWEAETDRYFETIRKNTEIRVLMPNFPPYLSCAAQSSLDHRAPRVYRMAQPGIQTPARRPR